MKNKKTLIIIGAVVSFILIFVIILFLGISGALFFGINKTQEASRDTQRQNFLQDINLELALYYSENGNYPNNIDFQPTRIFLDEREIKIKSEFLTPQKETNTEGTAYCYRRLPDSTYKLGVKKEDGEWFNLSYEKCTDEDIVD